MKELKEFMNTAKTVKEWNLLREEAKSKFTHEQINQLDASGFIVEVLNQ